jgi:hypothetical protein
MMVNVSPVSGAVVSLVKTSIACGPPFWTSMASSSPATGGLLNRTFTDTVAVSCPPFPSDTV